MRIPVCDDRFLRSVDAGDSLSQTNVAGASRCLVPLSAQVIDGLLHIFWRTPHLLLGTILSLVLFAYGSLFDWYAMRQGVLLTGEGAGSFLTDLRALPVVFLQLIRMPAKLALCLVHADHSTSTCLARQDHPEMETSRSFDQPA